MADFVESATLRLIDETTGPLAEINKGLAKLRAEAAKTQKALDKTSKLKFDTASISKATTAINHLETEARKLSRPIDLRINSSSLTSAATRATRLQHELNSIHTRPIDVRANTSQLNNAIRRVEQLRNLMRGRFTINAGANVNTNSPGGNRPDILGNVIGNVIGQAVYNAINSTVSTVARGALDEDRQLSINRAAMGRGPEGAARANALSFIADAAHALYPQVTRASGLDIAREAASQGTSVQNVTDITTLSARNEAILGALYGDLEKAHQSAIKLQKTVALTDSSNSPAKFKQFSDAFMQMQLVNGVDFDAQKALDMMRQLGGVVRNDLSPAGFARIMNLSEEGGRAITAGIRMGARDMFRLNLNKKSTAMMADAGLRNPDGTFNQAELAKVTDDPVYYATHQLVEDLKRQQGFTDTMLNDAVKVSTGLQLMGFTEPSASGFAEAIVKRVNANINFDKTRAGNLSELIGPNASLQVKMQEFQGEFTTAASAAIQGAMPTLKAGLSDATDAIRRIATGQDLTKDQSSALTKTLFATAAAGILTSNSSPEIKLLGSAALLLGYAATQLLSVSGLLKSAAHFLAPSLDENGKTQAERVIDLQKAEAAAAAEKRKVAEARELVDLPGKIQQAQEDYKTAAARGRGPFGVMGFREDNAAANLNSLIDRQGELLRKSNESRAAAIQQEIDFTNNNGIDAAKNFAQKAIQTQAQFDSRLPGFTNALDAFTAQATETQQVATAAQQTKNALSAFAASLYDTSGAAISYADQLRKLQGLEGLKQTGTRDKETEKLAAAQRRTIDEMLGLKTVNSTIGRDDLNIFGVKNVKELQAKVGAPVDGVVGPITTRAALEFLKAAGLMDSAATKLYNSRQGIDDGRGTSTGLFKSPTAALASNRGEITGTSFDTATGRRLDDRITPRPAWEIANDQMIQSKIAASRGGSLTSLLGNVIEGGKTAILGALTGAEGGITSAGQAAATAIQNAVSGAGGAIVGAFESGGSSAAAKIAAAMSNANITLNAKVNSSSSKPLNTGTAALGHQ